MSQPSTGSSALAVSLGQLERIRSGALRRLRHQLLTNLEQRLSPSLAHPREMGVDLHQRLHEHRRRADSKNHFRSAGITCHGAHSVLVWDSISENAFW